MIFRILIDFFRKFLKICLLAYSLIDLYGSDDRGMIYINNFKTKAEF